MSRTATLTLLLTLSAAARVSAADDPELKSMKGPAGSTDIRFYPDGKKLLSLGADDSIRVWETATGKELAVLSKRKGLVSIRISSTGTVAAAFGSGEVQLWPADGEERDLTTDKKNPPTALAFAPDGKRIAVGDSAGGLKILSAEGGRFQAECEGHGEHILNSALAFTPDGKRLVSSSADRSLRVWETETGKKKFAAVTELGRVSHLTFAGDKVYFLDSYLQDSSQKCVDLTTGKVVGTNDVPSAGGRTSGLIPVLGGKVILSASASDSGNIFAWPTDKAKAVELDDRLSSYHYLFDVLPTQDDIVVSASGFKIITSRVSAKKEKEKDTYKVTKLRVEQEHTGKITSLAVSADGKLVATADEKGTIKVWDAKKLATPK